MRAVFFYEADADALAFRLREAGHRAVAAAERLAGEDDDEDPQWVVTTDASRAHLGQLLPDSGGWLETEAGPTLAAPMPLPGAPKRIKRPPR